jgi:hypothetical protein
MGILSKSDFENKLRPRKFCRQDPCSSFSSWIYDHENENTLREKDSPTLVFNASYFRKEVVSYIRTINSEIHFLCVLG